MSGFTLKGVVGRYVKTGQGAETPLRLTTVESLAVAQVEPPLAEVTRSGARYAGGCQVIASGIAPVSAIPTTTATLALWNGEQDTGRAYYVDRVNFGLGSGTAAAGATLFLGVSSTKIARPSAASNYSTQNMNPGSQNASKAIWATAQTFPSGTAWFAAQSTFQLAAANVGQGDGWTQLDGGLLVPPGYALGFALLSGAGTTPLYFISAQWSEIENDPE